ncbi:hypothetical protein [Leptospira sp. GIMC2001]|uniref:hypothetical protein n=1 Tax=Leptospira sp. GIMC2001 TaxID=1513297 RepID=UPI0023497884|nr:hypothetical protein [Leptospira sp. GIMC2001]WCL49263.1 hypothetical protein O4O04_18515 [Leptospira sp. GIMC2001]
MRIRIYVVSILIFGLFYCGKEIPELKPMGDKGANCQKIGQAPGPEDFELIRAKSKDYLIVSSHERRIPNLNGGLFYLELKPNLSLSNSQGVGSQKNNPLVLTPLKVDSYPPNFRPHGISSTQVNGKNRLYVISHPKLENLAHTIEIFEEASGSQFSWKHIETLSSNKLMSPNDLFALPEGKLLISNDGTANLFVTLIDLVFNLNTSDITYYENGKWYLLDQKIPFGNGIWYEENNEEKLIYRASHFDQSIYVYSARWIENSFPILNLKYKIPFSGGVDNLYKTEKGFYASIHPSNTDFLGHAKDKSKFSPSQIYRINLPRDSNLIYSNLGDEISAASGAIAYGKTLFISQVFEDFILACDLK